MKLKPAIFVLAAATLGIAQGQTSFTSTSATTAWNTSRWNNVTDVPAYTDTYAPNNPVNFTSGIYTFAGMGANINVGNITVSDNVVVTFTSASNTFQTNGTVRTINVGIGGTMNFAGQAISTAAGTGFNKTGVGTMIITNGNTYTGGFTLGAGTMIAGSVNAMGAGGVLNLNGGILSVNNNTARDFSGKYTGGIAIGGNIQFGDSVNVSAGIGTMTFSNTMTLGGANRTLTLGNSGNVTFGGVISNLGSTGLTFAATAGGTGRFEITGTANTFTGPVYVNGGEVRFTADESLGNLANDVIIDGGRFSKANDSAAVALAAGRDIAVGDAAGTAISSPGSGILIYNNAIANKSGSTGTWAKQGSGTLELGGASTYTGSTAINNGIIRLTAGNDRLPTGTVVSLGQAASSNLGTLDLNARNQQIAGLTSTAGTNATVSNNTVASTFAATLTINTTGSNSYTYGDGTNTNSGLITGAISLVKSGTGTQALGDTNTYIGTTTINDGILAVNGSLASGSAVTVNSGGTLGGTGTVSGTVTAKSGGIVGPGNSPGVLTTGATTFESGSIFSWELNNNLDGDVGDAGDTGIRGTNYDGLTSSSLAVASGAIFRVVLTGTAAITNTFWDQNQTWTNIFSVSGSTTNAATGQLFNTFEVFNGTTNVTLASSSEGAFSFNSSTLTWTAVPEPSSALAGLLLGAGLLRRRRVA